MLVMATQNPRASCAGIARQARRPRSHADGSRHGSGTRVGKL